MKKWIILCIMLACLLASCAVPTATLPPTSIPSATVQPSATPTVTPLPTATPEPTTPPEAFVIQPDGLKALNRETGAYEAVPRTDTGLYLLDGQLFGWDTANNQPVEPFATNGGNLKRWDQNAGRYRQVTVEINNKPENVKAQVLFETELGMVAEYNDGATALIDPATGEVFSLINQINLRDQTVLRADGKLVVWDGEKDAWVDTVQLHENQVFYWDGRSFTPLKNTVGETVSANMRIETPQGLVFAQDGVLTAVVDQNRPVAAYGGEAPIGFKVYHLEGGNLAEIPGKTWFDWRLYEPNTGDPRADLTHVNFPDAAKVALGGMFVDPAIGRFRATLNNPGAITGFWNEIVRRSSSDPERPVLTFKAINIHTGQLETFSNVPVSQIDFYATAQNIPDGMPFLPFVTPYASSPAESGCFGLVYDHETGKLFGILDLSTKASTEWEIGILPSDLVILAGRMVLGGMNFPEFPTSISPVSGRNVLDQSSNKITDAVYISRQVGLDFSVIGWRSIR